MPPMMRHCPVVPSKRASSRYLPPQRSGFSQLSGYVAVLRTPKLQLQATVKRTQIAPAVAHCDDTFATERLDLFGVQQFCAQRIVKTPVGIVSQDPQEQRIMAAPAGPPDDLLQEQTSNSSPLPRR